MTSAGFILKLTAGTAGPALSNLIANPHPTIFAAIIIIIVAAAASAVAKNILQPVRNWPGGRSAVNASRVIGALEQVGKAAAIVNGGYHAGPSVITIPVKISIGFGGI